MNKIISCTFFIIFSLISIDTFAFNNAETATPSTNEIIIIHSLDANRIANECDFSKQILYIPNLTVKITEYESRTGGVLCVKKTS